MLLDLMPNDVVQAEFGFDFLELLDGSKLMAVMDALNECFGRDTIHVGSEPRQRAQNVWRMRQERLTPQYTTNWSGMPVAW